MYFIKVYPFQNSRDCVHRARADIVAVVLQRTKKILSRVVDTGNNIDNALRVGRPNNNDLKR